MKPKLLIFSGWLFYLVARRTSDEVWYVITAYSLILAICALFYRREKQPGKHQKVKS